jgi:DNA-binding transcriptional regulator YdaS (Cro superfamily)
VQRAEHRARARLAIAYAIALVGTQRELAHQITLYLAANSAPNGKAPLSITSQAVQLWLKRGQLVDKAYWAAFEEITDGQVTRRHLRPDLYNASPPPALIDPRLLDEAQMILSKYEALA